MSVPIGESSPSLWTWLSRWRCRYISLILRAYRSFGRTPTPPFTPSGRVSYWLRSNRPTRWTSPIASTGAFPGYPTCGTSSFIHVLSLTLDNGGLSIFFFSIFLINFCNFFFLNVGTMGLNRFNFFFSFWILGFSLLKGGKFGKAWKWRLGNGNAMGMGMGYMWRNCKMNLLRRK